jgi:hypothetical protein
VQPSTDLTGAAGPQYGVPRHVQLAASMSYISHSDHARGGMCRCWSVQARGAVPTCVHTVASRTKIAFREGEQLGRNALALWGQCICHGAESAEIETVLTGMLWLSTRYPCAAERCEFQAWNRRQNASRRRESGRNLSALAYPSLRKSLNDYTLLMLWAEAG